MRIVRKLVIKAEPKAVWRSLVEPDFRKIWLTNLVEEIPDHPDQPVGVGSSSRVKLRQNNRVVEYRTVVKEWIPESRLRSRMTIHLPQGRQEMEIQYTLESGEFAQETIIACDFNYPLRGILRLMYPLIRRGARHAIDTNLDRLAEVAESL